MLFSGIRLRRRDWLLSGRVQLVIAILLGVALPLLGRLVLFAGDLSDRQAANTAGAIAVSIVCGYWLLRRVSTLPGVQMGAGIFPSFGMAFAVVAFSILILRVDYTRSILLVGFVVTITWFYIVYAYSRSRELLSIGLVEGGNVTELAQLPQLYCRTLSLDQVPVGIDAVAADFRANHSQEWEARLADFALSGLPVYHSKDLHESLSGRSNLEHLSENNLGGLQPLDAYMQIKLAIDVTAALVALIVLTPVFVLVALAIKLDSPGPVMFRQHRAGFGGVPFRVFKFRTMTVTNEGGAGSARESFITQANDSRVTRVGRFLRRSRIDELPQIVNVVRGEMSWIGPRPEAVQLAEWYEGEIPFYRYRHIVRPGITGWAQINQGHVAEIDDIRLKLQYDFFYIRNFSAFLDMVILFRTVRTVMTGFGHK